MHDALEALSVLAVTHSVPMAKNQRPRHPAGDTGSRPSPGMVLDRLSAGESRAARITHTEHMPAREGRHAVWPHLIRPEVISAIQAAGIEHPWAHQAEAAEAALNGDSVVIATGTASGKSLAYLAPVLTTLLDGAEAPNGRGATALYLSPTKALAADQRRAEREHGHRQVTTDHRGVADAGSRHCRSEWGPHD